MATDDGQSGGQSGQADKDIQGRGVAAFCCALRFLTVVPVSWRAERDGDLFPNSLVFFPLTGLLIGLSAMFFSYVALALFPGQVVAFLALVFLGGISGFLHLDGLADSGDGLLSYRPKEQSLDIMKDSRTGAMGVVVLVLVLLGKYVALTTLAPQLLPLAVLLMPLGGRTAIVITMALYRYARPEGGLGNLFYSSMTRRAALRGVGLLLVCGWLAAGLGKGVMIGLTVMATVLVFGTFCRRRLGGVTGDTLGAVSELTELTVALGFCALLGG